MKLVYLAGPYTHPDPVENTHKIIQEATKIVEDGIVTPVVPHLSLLWHMVTPRPESFWYDYDLQLLKRCDALLRFPGASWGADNEVLFANERSIPVFYSLEDLYSWAKK